MTSSEPIQEAKTIREEAAYKISRRREEAAYKISRRFDGVYEYTDQILYQKALDGWDACEQRVLELLRARSGKGNCVAKSDIQWLKRKLKE